MRILITSDPHFDYNQQYIDGSVLDACLNFLEEKKPDYFIIAGDIASGAHVTIPIINALNTVVPTLWVPGNHDMWTEEWSSWMDYRQAEVHPTCLCGKPKVLGDHVVIGDMGWYDYTFGSARINPEQFKYLKRKLWNDDQFCKWNDWSDPKISDYMIEKLEEQIKQFPDKKIIFVTHTVPYKNFLSYIDADSPVTDGYMGSKKMGEMIDRYSNIEYVVFGHTHKRFGMVEFGDKKVICSPIGYERCVS